MQISHIRDPQPRLERLREVGARRGAQAGVTAGLRRIPPDGRNVQPSAGVPTEGARKASIRPGPDRRKAWQMPKRGATGHRSGKSKGVDVAEVLAPYGRAVPAPKRRRFRATLLAGGVVALIVVAVNMSGSSAPPTGPDSASVRGDDPATVTETSSPSSSPAPPPVPPPAAPAADAPGTGAPSGGGPAVRNTGPSSGEPARANRSNRSPSPVPAPRPPADPAPPPAAPPPPPAPVPANPPPEEESNGFLDGLRDLLP